MATLVPSPPRAEPAPGDAGVSPTGGAVSGIVAAAVALAAGELVCALRGGGPSLITAVGTQFIDRFAASLKDFAVAVFGTNDKAALVVGIVVVSLLLGAALGRLAGRAPLPAVAGFAAFGAVGLFSYLDDPQGTAVTGVLAATSSVVAGVVTLIVLLRVARREGPPVPAGGTGAGAGTRRSFLAAAGLLALGAGAVAALGRRLGRSDVVESARRETVLPPAERAAAQPTAETPATAPPATPAAAPAPDAFDVPGLSPYITPNESFYRIDTALSTPQVDVASWSLRVGGMVERPFELTYDELVAMATTEDVVTLSCVSNEVGGRLVGNATWQGVPLATLLERAGVQDGATQIVGRSVDDFTAGFPTEVGLDGRTALVAVAMNGEPLPAAHGFPARLVVAGLYGYVSATKWLREIEVTTWEGFDGYWVPRGWSKEGPIKTMSRIDVPRSGGTLAAGPQSIAGVAWAPPGGISRVEVQVDDDPWVVAELGEAASGNTWVQWHTRWAATPGEHRIRVRATNADRETQTAETAPPAPDGATGWHTRTVRVS